MGIFSKITEKVHGALQSLYWQNVNVQVKQRNMTWNAMRGQNENFPKVEPRKSHHGRNNIESVGKPDKRI